MLAPVYACARARARGPVCIWCSRRTSIRSPSHPPVLSPVLSRASRERKAGERAGGRGAPARHAVVSARAALLSALASVCLCAPWGTAHQNASIHTKCQENACNRGAHRQMSRRGGGGQASRPARTPRGSPTPHCSSPRGLRAAGSGPQAALAMLQNCLRGGGLQRAAWAAAPRQSGAGAPGSQGGPTPATGRGGASDPKSPTSGSSSAGAHAREWASG